MRAIYICLVKNKNERCSAEILLLCVSRAARPRAVSSGAHYDVSYICCSIPGMFMFEHSYLFGVMA